MFPDHAGQIKPQRGSVVEPSLATKKGGVRPGHRPFSKLQKQTG
jgi:hypothetical protein